MNISTMAYTEKVSLSGSALSFLLYECLNSVNSQEGFLIGDVTSQITNHISDSHSDNARLDTQILIRTVLPLPSLSLFYSPTGRIHEDILKDLLPDTANEVVGWYKYRKNSSIKPTFRDKLLSKGLQKYFEKHHSTKNFVTCNLSSKVSSAFSTHSFTYRFGKINCFDMYEYIDDVTANLGEKHSGYKKPIRLSPHSTFNKIVAKSNVQTNDTNDAILRIQKEVDIRLSKEAKIAAKSESTIRVLEAEIKQMSNILAEKQAAELKVALNKEIEEKLSKKKIEMAEAYVEALRTPPEIDIINGPNTIMNSHHVPDRDSPVLDQKNIKPRSPSPILVSSVDQPSRNYAAALKNTKSETPSPKTFDFDEDLIKFEVNEQVQRSNIVIDDIKCISDSSPEY